MGKLASYWSCGGDIVAAHGQYLSVDDVEALHGLYVDEARAASAAGNFAAWRTARRMAAELAHALAQSQRWRRASYPTCVSLNRPDRGSTTRS